MANPVYVVALDKVIELEKEDLGHPDIPDLWDLLYRRDRQYAEARTPVEKRGLQCPHPERHDGQIKWMFLRQQRDGRREAVHQYGADDKRCREGANKSPEHLAWQNRAARAAGEGGFSAELEVSASGSLGRTQTDVLIKGEGDLRIGIEVQLSSLPNVGKGSLSYRVRKAKGIGITPWWHTDRVDYGQRNDTQWTRSDSLPAYVIENKGQITVWTGVRDLEFWRCDEQSPMPCPVRKRGRCDKFHTTPRPAPTAFDDLVRKTAAGLVVPLEYGSTARPQRFWVSVEDRDRYFDSLNGEAPSTSSGESERVPEAEPGASRNVPTCSPRQAIEPHSGPVCATCGRPTLLRDDKGRSRCWTCRAADPTQQPIVAPTIRRPTPGLCEAGATPCGAPGRLFASGWRCSEHQPAASRTQWGA